MLADRVRMSRLLDVDVGVKPEDIADENCKVATDADFSGTTNGNFKYIGTATRLVIPHVIKGVPVTSYANMFEGSTALIEEVRSNNPNVTNMVYMFGYQRELTSLDLSIFDTSNVTDMSNMFRNCSSLTTLDLSSFNTSNVTNMSSMFRGCGVTTLDLSSFDTSNVTNMNYMFRDSSATTGYARTQADADRFNASLGKPPGLVFVVK